MFTTLNPPVEDEANERIEWAERIERALHGHGVRTVFQPIVDLSAHRVCGYEALTRFDGPLTGKRIGPEQWFQAAHELGAGGELEAVCLASALSYRGSLPPGAYLSVNIDPDSLMSPRVQAVLAAQGDLNGVVIELTEHQPWTWVAIESAVMTLRRAGARIAIDNTGTGNSGLRQLVDCRPAMLKVDRQLIESVDTDEAKLALVEMMAVFARRIGAELVAEGVEAVGEARALVDLGVHQAQGYLFGRPKSGWTDLDQASITAMLNGEHIRLNDPSGPVLQS